MGPLLNGAENMVTKHRENAQAPDAIFTLPKAGLAMEIQSQVPETSGKVRNKQDLFLVQED